VNRQRLVTLLADVARATDAADLVVYDDRGRMVAPSSGVVELPGDATGIAAALAGVVPRADERPARAGDPPGRLLVAYAPLRLGAARGLVRATFALDAGLDALLERARDSVLALGAFCFACCGLAATAHAKNWEFFAYFFTFWVTPMFVFCGVFFEVTRFPWFVQSAAWLLPMTHLIAVVRPLVTAAPLDPAMATAHVAYLAVLAAAAFLLARRRFARRVFD